VGRASVLKVFRVGGPCGYFEDIILSEHDGGGRSRENDCTSYENKK
jgi:hypothetical protein